MWLSQCQWCNPEVYGKIDQYHNKAWAVGIIFGIHDIYDIFSQQWYLSMPDQLHYIRSVMPEAGIKGRDKSSLIARFMGQTWGPSGADRTQVGPMLVPWTLSSGIISRAGTSNYIPQILWDVITCPCHWHLLRTQLSSFALCIMSQII